MRTILLAGGSGTRLWPILSFHFQPDFFRINIVDACETTIICSDTSHRLENQGKIPLEMIEVQIGEYLGEDDIIRLNDHYGR
ncbi:MAG TPA: hypothetical protein HA365_02795 [Methanocalculus sp.]|nr:hypothetical protein [Methanocalculus sp.]